MTPDIPLSRDIVLIGGGHAHALLLRMWGMRPLPGARLTLISPAPVAEYSGMLPGFVAGAYTRDDLAIDLVRLARHAGARLILDRAVGLDRDARHVLLAGREPVAYDIASIDIGVTAQPPDLPGFAEHALPVKPTARFVPEWQSFAESGGGRVVVIGGGLAGVELALAAASRLPGQAVTVVEAGAALMREVSNGARDRVLARARARGLTVLAGQRVVAVTAQGAVLEGGAVLPADLVIGAGGGWVPGWVAGTGLDLIGDRIAVGADLVTSDPAILACGDCAILRNAPRPQAGVFAVRQAPILAENIRRLAMGRSDLRRYRPQRDWLRLIAGGGDAVADKWGRGAGGDWVGRWKDRIDRRFMAMLSDLPAMPASPLPTDIAEGAREAAGDKPLCGGCGAKMGRAALRRVLTAQPRLARDDILTGPGDDAAVIVTGGARQVLTTDHLRAFTLDPALMARIAAIHALGDIRAMGARGQSALLQITLPRMSETLQERTLGEIMSAAAAVLNPAGAPIIGGHSAVGAELVIGLSLTGLADDPIGQIAQPGDALILTKPIGTGVILAAEMARAAPGPAVAAALGAMATDQAAAATILAAHGTRANAMTDITGFGLAGHLAGIAEASRLTAQADLAALPIHIGAEALSAAGHRSSLYPANRASVIGIVQAPDTPLGRLVFDPQTAGGLLAAIPEDRAEAAVAAIKAAGDTAWIIGRMTQGPARVMFA